MGQIFGKARIQDDVKHFINIPNKTVIDLLEASNLVAESFGLTLSEVKEMFRISMRPDDSTRPIGVTNLQFEALVESFYHVFDKEHGDVVDTFEFLSTIIISSDTPRQDKINLIFRLYDIEEKDALSQNEVNLIIRACASGLCKISQLVYPTESQLQIVASAAFEGVVSTISHHNQHPSGPTVGKKDFLEYALFIPEICSWLDHFEDIDIADSMKDHCKRLPSKSHLETNDYELLGASKIPPPADYETWYPMVKFAEPDNLQSSKYDEMPNAYLDLDWIYGRNLGMHGGNNVAYIPSTGHIIYPAGAIGVVLTTTTIGETSQSYFKEHSHYIACLTTYTDTKGSTIVGTSEMGAPLPVIKIWDPETLETMKTMKGFHRNGILLMDFSSSGQLLLAMGMDSNHCIAIYKWSDSKILYTTQTTKENVRDCRFLESDFCFGICGESFVHIWEADTSKSSFFKRRRCLFDGRVSTQTMTALTCINGTIISGGVNGVLYAWEGRFNSFKKVLGTQGSITCIHVVRNSPTTEAICVTTSDGKIFLMNERLESLKTHTVYSYGNISKCIDVVSWDRKDNRLLVGLSSSELFEVDSLSGKMLRKITCGHSGGSLCGLHTNPQLEDEVATVGLDGVLRLWNTRSRSLTKMKDIGTPGNCIAYNSTAHFLAVGLRPSTSPKMNEDEKSPSFVILAADNLSVKYYGENKNVSFLDCKYSNDDNLLAFSSQDKSIYIYCAKKYSLMSRAKGHTGPIDHIDFGFKAGSHKSSVLQSNSTNGEVMFWDINGKSKTPRSQRNIAYESRTCPLDWALKSAGSRAKITACDNNKSRDVVVLADVAGKIRLHKYPIISRCSSLSVELSGHGGKIGNIRFSKNDNFLYSIGEFDCCLMQWKYVLSNRSQRNKMALVFGEQPAVKEDNKRDIEGFDQSFYDVRESVISKVNPMTYNNLLEKGKNLNEEEGRSEEKENIEDTTQFSAVKPWERNVVAPTNDVNANGNKDFPHQKLVPKWIQGYDSSKQGISFTEGNLLYFVGRYLISYDPRQHRQWFYQASAEVTCMVMHPKNTECAMGSSSCPNICCVNTSSMVHMRDIKLDHHYSVRHLAFDISGKRLISLEGDLTASLTLIDWDSGLKIAKSQTTHLCTNGISFISNDKGIIQYGDEFLRFWDLNGNSIVPKTALTGLRNRMKCLKCIGIFKNDVILGAGDGILYILDEDHKFKNSIKTSDSEILSVCCSREGFLVGSDDGTVRMYDSFLACKFMLKLQDLGSFCCSVKDISWDVGNDRVAIGTSCNEIWELSAVDGSNFHHDAAVKGHSKETLSGLSMRPDGRVYATVGDDSTLRLWDIDSMSLIKSFRLEMASRACTYCPDGSMIAIGFGLPVKTYAKEFHGKWIILGIDENSFRTLFEHRQSRKMITLIKWSRDGEYIAVGSDDCKVYLYSKESGKKDIIQFALNSVIDQHYTSIRHIDFSVDSKYFQVNCKHNLNFFQTETGDHITETSSVRDVTWDTHNCTFGWPVKGIWSRNHNSAEMTCVDCLVDYDDETMSTLVAGDNRGCLHLHLYPCLSQGSTFMFKGHVGAVAHVKWASKRNLLVSTGRDDKAIIIWKTYTEESKYESLRDQKCIKTQSHDENFGLSKYTYDCNGEISRPWVASIIAPSAFDKCCSRKNGKHRFALRSICSGNDTANDVFYNGVGNIIYTCSTLAVTFDVRANQQSFFVGHRNLISAMSISSDLRHIASAGVGDNSCIIIWDANTRAQINVMKHVNNQGIHWLSFSNNSTYLISAGSDNQNRFCVWKSVSGEWLDGCLLYISECGHRNIKFLHVLEHPNRNLQIVSGGDEGTQFWMVEKQCVLPLPHLQNEEEGKEAVLCGSVTSNSKWAIGGKGGNLMIWDSDIILESKKKAHDGQVDCIYGFLRGIISGGSDGHIIVWSLGLEIVKDFDLNVSNMNRSMLPRTICTIDKNGGALPRKVLFQTVECGVYEISPKTENITCIQKEVHRNIRGLACHPTDNDLFASCGNKSITYWSISMQKQIKVIPLEMEPQSICWSSDGTEMVVGSTDIYDNIENGTFFLIDVLTSKIKFKHSLDHGIRLVKFSPNNLLFAIATKNNDVLIFENAPKRKYPLKSVAKDNKSKIESIDFSKDSYFLQTGSDDLEHMRFETDYGDRITLQSQLRNTEWATYTCIYGWHVQGIWPHINDHKDNQSTDYYPMSVDRSSTNEVLAVGLSNGEVRLYQYPVLPKQEDYHSVQLHAGPVSHCCFNCDGTHLITNGTMDGTIAIWKVVMEES